MKKFFLTMTMILTTMLGADAMTYEQASNEALFLTDKMAYELNLNPQQYDAAYEINLDYLLGVNTVDDVYSLAWRQRNNDLQYILHEWQWSAFCAASYFFRPLFWGGGGWQFAIYTHYPRRNYYYFDRPTCFVTYRGGGHSWRMNGGRSWYVSHDVHIITRTRVHHGMRDSWSSSSNRGGYGHSNSSVYRGGSYNGGNGNRERTLHIGGTNQRDNGYRESSTRRTMDSNNSSYNRGSYGRPSGSRYDRSSTGSRYDRTSGSSYDRSSTGSRYDRTSGSNGYNGGSSNRGTYGRPAGSSSTTRSNFGGNSGTPHSSFGGGNGASHSSGNFGGSGHGRR